MAATQKSVAATTIATASPVWAKTAAAEAGAVAGTSQGSRLTGTLFGLGEFLLHDRPFFRIEQQLDGQEIAANAAEHIAAAVNHRTTLRAFMFHDMCNWIAIKFPVTAGKAKSAKRDAEKNPNYSMARPAVLVSPISVSLVPPVLVR
jgi:hypothetical protein